MRAMGNGGFCENEGGKRVPALTQGKPTILTDYTLPIAGMITGYRSYKIPFFVH